jgi:hypothetical protein
MKRIVPALLLLSLGLTGCFPMDFLQKPTPPPPKVEKAPVVEKAPPVVTEDQVNEKTAGDCAKALRTELEYKLLDGPTEGE